MTRAQAPATEPAAGDCRAVRAPGAGAGAARRRLRGRLLRPAGVAERGGEREDAAGHASISRRRHSGRTSRALPARAPTATDAEMWSLRRQYLAGQLRAIRARVAMLQGEAVHLRRGVARALRRRGADAHRGRVQAVLAQLEAKLPGAGPLIERLRSRSSRTFVIPRDRLDAVFQAAIRACRERTLEAHRRCRRARASRWSTSRASPGAATTGTRATTRA